MCGLAGILGPGGADPALASAFAAALAHRGPDAEGQWSDPAAGIALAHRRLSIVDLSPAGAQPTVSADGRWVLAYNAEIYDHAALRAVALVRVDLLLGQDLWHNPYSLFQCPCGFIRTPSSAGTARATARR